MALRIYNSLTKKKEEFVPLEKGKVKMYVCGPTVYDEPHIGHLRSAYVFDVIRRYLEYCKYKVTFVRNVTDVDDKIIEKAKESSSSDLIEEAKKVTQKYYDAYKADLTKLGIKEPTTEPFATRHIEDMIFLIQKLLEKGAAYQSGGDVYYSVQAFGSYGKLSNQKKDSMLEHVRIDANEKKKDPLDFALWKKAKEDEPAWDSPWGKGRPGWHLECSAMSMKYLGSIFDIHGGGLDLVFPHHENEIAQSEAVTGSAFVRYWVHHGLVTVNNQKMSKSLKNYVTLSDCVRNDPEKIEDLKFLFLKTHYSAPLDYSEKEMAMVRSIRNNFKFFIDEAKSITEKLPERAEFTSVNKEIISLTANFIKAMDDDFNTPQMIAEMHKTMHAARQVHDDRLILAVSNTIRERFHILGVNFDVGVCDINQIENAIKKREEAKENKDYKTADAIRKEYLDKGIEFIDRPTGTTWRKR